MPPTTRILLIDRSRSGGDRLESALGTHGVVAEIVQVESVEDALEAIATDATLPNAIVVDYADRADSDTVRLLRQVARTSNAHLIAHARADDPPTRRHALAAGADHVVGAGDTGHGAVADLLRRLLAPASIDDTAAESDLLQWLVFAGEGRLGPQRAVHLLMARGVDEPRARILLRRWLEQG
nr:hypothetical protein [Planctomycetota bacterium]